MEKKNILSEEIVLQRGKEFSGDVCYSGEFGKQVFDKPKCKRGGRFETTDISMFF